MVNFDFIFKVVFRISVFIDFVNIVMCFLFVFISCIVCFVRLIRMVYVGFEFLFLVKIVKLCWMDIVFSFEMLVML